MKITCIGAGNMGSALCKGIQNNPNTTLSIADRNQDKLDFFKNVQTSLDPREILQTAECVIIAVKPQSFDELCNDVNVLLENKLIVSVMAGISIESIKEKTKANKIVRTLPNLGVQVGRGVTAWCTSDVVSQIEKEEVDALFTTCGISMEIAEDIMDEFSTIFGCGPAYFYSLCTILKNEAMKLGIQERDAEVVAKQTFIGSALFMEQKLKTLDELIHEVASKGGVTQAALDVLQKEGRAELFTKALAAAAARSKELGK